MCAVKVLSLGPCDVLFMGVQLEVQQKLLRLLNLPTIHLHEIFYFLAPTESFKLSPLKTYFTSSYNFKQCLKISQKVLAFFGQFLIHLQNIIW